MGTSYNLGQQRKVSGRVGIARSTLYEGTRTEVSYSGRVAVIPQFAVEPSISINRVNLPFGDFTATLLGSRIIVTPGPRMMISSLVQYNATAHSVTSSVRLRWEYHPGSDLFVVYSDGRNTQPTLTSPGLQNRTIAIKATRLLRF